MTDDLLPAAAPEQRPHARVVSFRSRRDALTPARQRAWDQWWPSRGAEAGSALLDTTAWFGREAPLIVEIGSGTGTATAAMAAAEPERNLLAIEVYRPGLAQLLQHCVTADVHNVRAVRGDAVQVLTHQLALASLAGVRVFFPDPWPKHKHHKRRLLQQPVVELIASRLMPGAVLHVATDCLPYAEQVAEVGDAEPRLQRIGFDSPAAMVLERPVTKFEGRAERAGSAITELLWGRITA